MAGHIDWFDKHCRGFYAALTGWSLAWGGWYAIRGRWGLVAISVAGVAVNVGCLVAVYRIKKKERHGSDRSTEAGAQDPGSFTVDISAHTSALTAALQRASGSAARLSYKYPALASGGVVPSRQPAAEVEQVESDMPILAHRIARLAFNGTDRPFLSLNQGGTFGRDAEAECRGYAWRITTALGGTTAGERHGHKVPDLQCGCGFYALPSDVEPWEEGVDFVTLMVELSGTVIEHEKGYRAQHQRVVECQLPACPYCHRQADVVLAADGVMTTTACRAHVSPVSGVVEVDVEDVAALVGVPVTLLGRGS